MMSCSLFLFITCIFCFKLLYRLILLLFGLLDVHFAYWINDDFVDLSYGVHTFEE